MSHRQIVIATAAPLLVAVLLAPGVHAEKAPPARAPSVAPAAAPGAAAPAPEGAGPTASATPSTALPPPRSDADLVARADALYERHDLVAADTLLVGDDEAAAMVVRARALRTLGDLASAATLLEQAPPADTLVAPYFAVERALVALARGQPAAALELVAPLLAAGDVAAAPVVEPLARALATLEPARFLEHQGELERLRRRDDPDLRSRLLGWQADALRRLGRAAEALAVDKSRWLEEPVSLVTPATPPAGVPVTNVERLARVELLQAQNRNERVIEALDALSPQDLTPPQRCQRALALGLALRKVRDYARSEAELGRAVAACKADDDRARRALYLQAKVVSIRDGLRSIPLMEAFIKRYPAHSMDDDVLFWAGDVFQRRDPARAEAYYRRIETLPGKDDYCLEARWRLAWMAYRRGDLASARDRLHVMLGPGCSSTAADRARGHYWLARIAQSRGDLPEAVDLLRQTVADDVVGFHAQLAVTHLADLAPEVARGLTVMPPAPVPLARPEGCAAAIDAEPGISRAEALLARGLRTDAARVLLAVVPPAAEVISSTHASAIGVTARYVEKGSRTTDPRCDRALRLYLALLLDRAGAYKDAAWRLRTEFAQELSGPPTPATAALWRAAYPLAWRDEIAAGERESKLPELLLQALSREESAFDAQVVSWAGAYGLTQLLLSTGRDAGRLLTPKVSLARAEDLLDPALNARLGGAFLASLLARFDGSTALALAGYNAGSDAAASWWKRFGGEGVDVLGEEIPIQETRGYVKRVLRTYGVYRWLYKGETPALPLAVTPAATARR